MCRKCADRRSHSGVSRNFISNAHPAEMTHTLLASRGEGALSINNRFLEIPNISVETMSCKCGGAAESIAAELKAFIPIFFLGIFIVHAAFKFLSKLPGLHSQILLPPQPRPG